MALFTIIVLGVSAIVGWLAWLEYREDLVASVALSKGKSLRQNAKADACDSQERVAD
jgi:predicted negative regulator of RcsB-dependent stress response